MYIEDKIKMIEEKISSLEQRLSKLEMTNWNSFTPQPTYISNIITCKKCNINFDEKFGKPICGNFDCPYKVNITCNKSIYDTKY